VYKRQEREGITNIETIVGEVDDPLLPEGLDMAFIVNAFHDIARQVVLLDNLAPSLKPGAAVVILDRDPEKFRDSTGHFLTREEVLERIAESVFELDRIETFLPQHNIYIIRIPTGHGVRGTLLTTEMDLFEEPCPLASGWPPYQLTRLILNSTRLWRCLLQLINPGTAIVSRLQ